MKTKNRVISFLLATVMLITFALPVSAMEIAPVQDVIDIHAAADIMAAELDKNLISVGGGAALIEPIKDKFDIVVTPD